MAEWIKNSWKILLLCLILADTVYSFLQHNSRAFDGDLVPIVYPDDHYQTVLENPFGEAVLWHDELYAGSNRFFIHWAMYETFQHFPLWLQHFMSPIDSIYATAAISKILIQLLILGLLGLFVTSATGGGKQSFLIACFLIVPLFQSTGYYFNGMGIIDQSITYAFFYALPISFFLLYTYPFLFRDRWRWNWWKIIVWLGMSVVLPFSGALIPGIVLVGILTLGIKSIVEIKKSFRPAGMQNYLPRLMEKWSLTEIALVGIIAIVSIYSLYIGRNNIEGLSAELSLLERFQRMPSGLIKVLFEKPGYLMIFLLLGINTVLLRKLDQRKEFYLFLKWFGVFALLYLLLLPLGGYRDYRPLIIRRDTFMPVFFGLIILYGYSTTILLPLVKGRIKWVYMTTLAGSIMLFTMADITELDQNHCERECLQILADSKEEITGLPADCTLLNWTIRRDPKKSVNVAEMIHRWQVTDEVRLFYQE